MVLLLLLLVALLETITAYAAIATRFLTSLPIDFYEGKIITKVFLVPSAMTHLVRSL